MIYIFRNLVCVPKPAVIYLWTDVAISDMIDFSAVARSVLSCIFHALFILRSRDCGSL